MRQILVDDAGPKRKADKRGGTEQPVSLDGMEVAGPRGSKARKTLSHWMMLFRN